MNRLIHEEEILYSLLQNMENEILLRYIDGTATQEEITQVVKWLDADKKNMQEYMLLRQAFDVSLWNSSKSEDAKHVGKTQSAKRFNLIKEFLKIAAVFALMLGSYHLVLSKWINSEEDSVNQTIFTPEGQRAELVLSDGTKVWLNAKSTLIFPDKFSGKERNVKLIGEAYFDVAHDAKKQFVVEAQDYKIKVLGTEFNVKSYPQLGLFETSLIRGSVKITSVDDVDQLTLVPGDIIFSEKGTLSRSNIEDHDMLAWKDGVLAFKDLQLREILDKLSLYYDVEFTVKNKTVLDDTYTGKFWIKDGVDQVLRVLGLYNKFSYTKDELNHITIY